jgi:tetratricopeptide (TPR) repeat protein
LEEIRNSSKWNDAESLASLVAASVNGLDPVHFDTKMKNDLRAELMIELANSRRRAAEWRRAQEALEKAEAFLAAGTGDRALRARYLVILGHLEADQGRSDSAVTSFTQSRSLYEEIGADHLVGRTLLELADTLSEREPRAGLEYLDQADEYLVPGDPLFQNARLMRVDCLIWTGELREATRWMLSCQRPKGGRLLIRYRFIEARLLYALDQKREAERLFHEVVTDDLESELFKDALLDLLYLLRVHLSEGDNKKALEVCRRALSEPLLARFSHDQLKSVWNQIATSLKGTTLDSGVISSVKDYMILHWRHPAPEPPYLF